MFSCFACGLRRGVPTRLSSVNHVGYYAWALGGGRLQDCSCMPVRTLFLVAQLVVVCSKSPSAVATRVGFFTLKLGINFTDLYILVNDYSLSVLLLTSMDAHVSIPSGSVVQSFSTDGAFLPLLWIAHSSRLQFLHIIVQLHLCLQRLMLF